MADGIQVGSVNTTLTINTNDVNYPIFPYAYDSGYATNAGANTLTPGIVYNDYLYVAIMEDNTDTVDNRVTSVHRLNVADPVNSKWEIVTNGIWQGSGNALACMGVYNNRFYVLGGFFSSNPRGWTAYYDITTNLWQDAAVLNFGDSGYYASVNSKMATQVIVGCGNYLYHRIPGDYRDKGYWAMYKWDLNSLTSAPTVTSESPQSLAAGYAVTYGSDIYYLGGRTGTARHGTESTSNMGTIGFSSTGSTWYTQSVTKYDTTTNTWTSNALPPIPAITLRGTGITIAGSVIYIVMPYNNMCHYYDIKWGSTGTWKEFYYPVMDTGENTSLTFDPTRRCLWYIDSYGRLFKCELKPDYTPVTGWWNVANRMLLETIQVEPYTDATFSFTTTSSDFYNTNTVDVTFTIGSVGQQITSYTTISTSSPTITITALSSGVVGEISTSATASIIINTQGTNIELSNTSPTFYIDTEGEGIVVASIVQNLSKEILFTIDSQGSGFREIILNSTPNTTVLIDSDGTLLKNVFETSSATNTIIVTTDAIATINGVASGACDIKIDLINGVGGVYLNDVLITAPPMLEGWAVNCITGGHAAFTNYKFNGMFKIGGKFFATSESGLFEITGQEDNGNEIESYVATPLTDFGTMKLKSVPDVYIHMRSDGESQFRLVTDEDTDRSAYVLSYDERGGVHRRRKQLHKGIKGTNWQVEIKNKNNSRLEVAQIDMPIAVLARTI